MANDSGNRLHPAVFWHRELPEPPVLEKWQQDYCRSAFKESLALSSSPTARDSLIGIFDAAARYPNGPLKDGEIRILTLHPGAWSSPIVCTLENIALKDAAVGKGGFCALSYTWGPPTQPRCAIWINHGVATVGEQLFEALAHLRDAHKPKRFWVDAVCIRQDDNEEKSTQLPLMTDIYSRASDVCIWLGPDEDDSGYAFATVRVAHGNGKPDDSSLPPKRLVEALTAILRRQWFSRLWIIQELALASNPAGPRVVTGFEQVRWNELNDTLASARKHIDWSSEKNDPVYAGFLKRMDDSPVVGLNLVRQHVQECGSLPLLLALQSTQFAQATDPRDKIYGLLGLLDDAGRANLAPNYAKDMGEVYKEATASVLRQNADRLRYMTYPTIPWRATNSTPSWVWDLSYSAKHYAFSLSGTLVGSDSKMQGPVLDVDDNILATNATIVDAVTETHQASDKVTSSLAGILRSYKRAKNAAGWWADAAGGLDPLWRSLRGEGNNKPPAKKATTEIPPTPEEVELTAMYTLFDASAHSRNKPPPSGPEFEKWYKEHAEPLYDAFHHAVEALERGSNKKPYFFFTENGLCGWCPEEPVLTSPDYKTVVAMLFRGSGTEIAFVMRQHAVGSYTIVCPATLPTNWVRLCEAKGNMKSDIVQIM
ncbi:heterokaryon incompatibility protein-domain-containing protein [Cladorrhinum samala]|uniref:Heterokaryon incompatibility protein-domain-containing protein n=1 Tax=Cladorrhinum samala TaxID=585594 RepID=A0AAV9HFB2_9PEZI|nr:heterokaryon incompatibility protein-domain-containing protein [Cladorrhinum samala]